MISVIHYLAWLERGQISYPVHFTTSCLTFLPRAYDNQAEVVIRQSHIRLGWIGHRELLPKLSKIFIYNPFFILACLSFYLIDCAMNSTFQATLWKSGERIWFGHFDWILLESTVAFSFFFKSNLFKLTQPIYATMYM